jgi:hypothetical protein
MILSKVSSKPLNDWIGDGIPKENLGSATYT